MSPPVTQETSSSLLKQPASNAVDAERVQASGLSSGTQTLYIHPSRVAHGHIGTSLNDELRAAVAKLVSEHSTPREKIVLDTAGEATAPSPKDGIPKLNVQIPVPDRLALPEKKVEEERGEDESDMDVSMPATPTDEVPRPTETVPVAVVPPSDNVAAPAPTTESAAKPLSAQSVVASADLASQPPQGMSTAAPQRAVSPVEESRATTEMRTLPLVDEK